MMIRKTVLAGAVAAALMSQFAVADNHGQSTDLTDGDTPASGPAAVKDPEVPVTGHQSEVLQNVTTDETATAGNGAGAADTATDDMAALTGGKGYSVADLIGIGIATSGDEDVGEIDDLLIDGNNNITHAVLSVGGMLGIGDKRVAVPFEELQIGTDGDDNELEVVYDATREELEAMDEYRSPRGNWRERMSERMTEWKEKAQDAMRNVTEKVKEVGDDSQPTQ